MDLRKVPHALFSILFPDECRICGVNLQGYTRVPVCAACMKASSSAALEADFFCVQCKTPFLNPFPLDEEGRCSLCRTGARGFDAAYCFGFYEGPLRRLVHLLKYSGMKPLAKPLGEYLSRALPLDEPFDVVVPMPLHWRRRLQRGFNQAALLAAEIGRRRRLPVANAVRRVRATESQIGLTNAKRRLNVRGAFRARGRAIMGRRVLLIDDVMTTGATASACAAALKRAGAKSVTLLTVARVDRRFTPFTPSAFASSSGEPPSSGAPTEAAPDRESTALWQTTGAS